MLSRGFIKSVSEFCCGNERCKCRQQHKGWEKCIRQQDNKNNALVVLCIMQLNLKGSALENGVITHNVERCCC